MTATEKIKAVTASQTLEELDAMLVNEGTGEAEARVTVLAAIEARREAILNPDPETLEDDNDGLVEVTTKGDVGTSKEMYVNGVASPVACGIVIRVTPEVAEQMSQCSLI